MATPNGSTTTPAPAPAPADGSGGGWIDGIKKEAIKQYDSFKKANPDAAAKLEGAVEAVEKQVEDFSLSQTEKAGT